MSKRRHEHMTDTRTFSVPDLFGAAQPLGVDLHLLHCDPAQFCPRPPTTCVQVEVAELSWDGDGCAADRTWGVQTQQLARYVQARRDTTDGPGLILGVCCRSDPRIAYISLLRIISGTTGDVDVDHHLHLSHDVATQLQLQPQRLHGLWDRLNAAIQAQSIV